MRFTWALIIALLLHVPAAFAQTDLSTVLKEMGTEYQRGHHGKMLSRFLEVGRLVGGYENAIEAAQAAISHQEAGRLDEALSSVLKAQAELAAVGQGADFEVLCSGALSFFQNQIILEAHDLLDKAPDPPPALTSLDEIPEKLMKPATEALARKDHWSVIRYCQAGKALTARLQEDDARRMAAYRAESELSLLRLEAKIATHHPASWLVYEMVGFRNHMWQARGIEDTSLDDIRQQVRELFPQVKKRLEEERGFLTNRVWLVKAFTNERYSAKDGDAFRTFFKEAGRLADDNCGLESLLAESAEAVGLTYERHLPSYWISVEVNSERARFLYEEAKAVLEENAGSDIILAYPLEVALDNVSMALDEIHEIAPDDWGAYLRHAEVRSSYAYESERELEEMNAEALEFVRKAAEVGHHVAEAQWLCAQGFLRAEDFKDALAALKRFVELAPSDPREGEAGKIIQKLEVDH